MTTNGIRPSEETILVDFICLACSNVWTGESLEGERPPCPNCDSEQVARA